MKQRRQRFCGAEEAKTLWCRGGDTLSCMHVCIHMHVCMCVFVYVYTIAIHVIVFGCVSVMMCVCVCLTQVPNSKTSSPEQGKQVFLTDCLLVVV